MAIRVVETVDWLFKLFTAMGMGFFLWWLKKFKFDTERAIEKMKESMLTKEGHVDKCLIAHGEFTISILEALKEFKDELKEEIRNGNGK